MDLFFFEVNLSLSERRNPPLINESDVVLQWNLIFFFFCKHSRDLKRELEQWNEYSPLKLNERPALRFFVSRPSMKNKIVCVCTYILPPFQKKYPVDFDDELKIGDVRYDDVT